ncbi:hypothetical protein HOLleu_34899 [Holothuria leucospilota]|uniref:Helix-turn-helix domain-containing protein n=1 Tax=Holothuria leucospilota TaxID=206669 RepID=A0A9Q0YLS1_HOLLE|nr:hypothetical protein HOLleu_34899 [Holothuria leucospilota]
MEISKTEVTYLDLKIFKGNKFQSTGILDTKVYTKPTETFQYLDRNSAHPLATFKGFIKGEVLRYARLCSNESDFLEKRNSFTERLLTRSYSPEEIAAATNGLDYKQRTNLLASKNIETAPPLVFKTTYTPHIKTCHLKQALTKHWNLIASDKQLSRLFPDYPTIAYKGVSNLKDLLVKSRFPPNQESDETEEGLILKNLKDPTQGFT